MATSQRSNLDFLNATRILNLPDGILPQHPATLAQLQAAIRGLAWKDNVRAGSVGNVTVMNPATATFDGVTLVVGDRLILKNQTVVAENGIYVFNGSGVALTRAIDADTFDSIESAIVGVDEGTQAGTQWRQTQTNGVLGTNPVVFASFQASAPAASETVSGIAEVATQAETDDGTDDARIVTPLKLATWPGRVRRFAADIGDGTATSIVVTHNLNTRDLTWKVRANGGAFDFVDVEVQATTVNTATLVFVTAPTANQFRVILHA
jgi:hypothetical protein